MNRDKNFYWLLFKSTFIVSMFAVSGASVTLDPVVAPYFSKILIEPPRSNLSTEEFSF